MAYSFNKIMLIGNLGQDPEMRYTTEGKPVANLSLATSRSYRKGENTVEVTDWHTVTVWGTGAEFIAEAAHKGDRVFVEGEMRSEKYTPKDGGPERTAWKVHTFNVMLMSPRRTTEGAPAQAGTSAAPPARTSAASPATSTDQDLPF